MRILTLALSVWVSGCNFCSPPAGGAGKWHISYISWDSLGGTVARVVQNNGYDSLGEHACTVAEDEHLDQAGQRTPAMVPLLLDCRTAPAPELGACVDTADGGETFQFADSSRLQVVQKPPSLERFDASGARRYRLDLDFDSITQPPSVRGDTLYLVATRAGVESVARIDVARGQLVWDVVLVKDGARE